MDTNAIIISQLVEALNAAYAKNSILQSAASGNSLAIVTQIGTFLITAVGLILTYFKAASADRKADKADANAENTKAETVKSLGHITTLVNDKDSKNMSKIEELEIRITKLTGENAALNEQAKASSITEQIETKVNEELAKQ